MKTHRPPRKRSPNRGYDPAGEPIGYEPAHRSRKAPSAYWCRNPYSDEVLERVKAEKAGKKR